MKKIYFIIVILFFVGCTSKPTNVAVGEPQYEMFDESGDTLGWLLSLICQYSIRPSGAFSLKAVKPAKGVGIVMKTWKTSFNSSMQILSEASISCLLMMWLLQELPSLPVLKNSVRLVVSVSASSHLASPRADKWNRQVVRGKSQTLDGSILNVI